MLYNDDASTGEDLYVPYSMRMGTVWQTSEEQGCQMAQR